MDPILIEYLDSVDRYLKPLPAYERADIIKEIRSEMLELESTQELSPSQILARLGEAKALAQAYLGDTIIAMPGADRLLQSGRVRRALRAAVFRRALRHFDGYRRDCPSGRAYEICRRRPGV